MSGFWSLKDYFRLFIKKEFTNLYFSSKVEVQNPGAFTADPKIRVVASWEPTVLATIIIPSE